jgi:hypothetical protein
MMDETTSAESLAHQERRRQARANATPVRVFAMVGVMVLFVLWAHLASGIPVFHSQSISEPGWDKFRADYELNKNFGDDGQFVRAVQNGYNLIHYTYKYAPRFVRKSAADPVNSCAGCHTAEDLAYAFVNSDRVDAKLGQRISFEDGVRRCYAQSLDGFVPTIYDPAVRDIRLLARAVAHHLQLGEGALKGTR